MRAYSWAMALLVLSMVGCATKRDFYAMSGSRADGTVDMAYDIQGPFDRPIVDMNQAASIAARKCNVWGYQDAEPFGGKSERCNQRSGFGDCISGQVVIQFQCLGDLESPRASAAHRAGSAAAVASALPVVGKHQFSAEKAAAAHNCTNTILVSSGPGVELYTAMCGETPTSVKCEFSNCAVQ